DPDGYTVTVGGTGGASQHITTNGGSVTFDNLAAGDHTVTLSDLASNCSVSGAASKTVTVPAGSSTTTSFTVDCPTPPPSPGSLTVTVNTTGGTPDPDGYTVTVGGTGGASQHITTNGGSVTFDNLAAGDHTVTLSGLASNCSVSGAASKTVTVPAGGSTSTSFSVSCPTPPPQATHLVFTQQPPTTVLLGSPFQVQVAAEDDQGNVVASYTGQGTIRIASS